MSKENSIIGRIIIQQCISAKLQTNADKSEEDPEYVTINRGVVVYVCFMKGTDEEVAIKMAKTVCNIKLSKQTESSDTGLVSVIDAKGDILVVPQATLGGKQKGNRMQYHGNITKLEGQKLYDIFVKSLLEFQHESKICSDEQLLKTNVKCGTYGNLQVLSVETNGPYTHILNF